jgi:phosphatidylglycerophosphate synthase
MQAQLDGRKIPRHYENPFDNVFIDIAHWFNVHVFRQLNFTPNMITTLSFISGVLIALLVYKKYYLAASASFLISYIMDCADGNYARMYNMVTQGGDIFDHVSDWTKLLLVFVLIYVRLEGNMQKYIFVVLTVILSISCGIHMGCQEKIYEKGESSTLHVTRYFCPNTSHITYTRLLGCGTLTMFYIVFMVILHFQK